MKFEWRLEKAVSNLEKHHVSFEDAATVFGDPLGRMLADPDHSLGEVRYILLGRSRRQRLLAVMFVQRGEVIRIIVRGRPLVARGKTMKKRSTRIDPVDHAEILPEYDFSRASPNKYASRYAAGSAVVVLEPDVAAAFPTAREANEALRALAGIIRKHRAAHKTSVEFNQPAKSR